MPELKRNFLKGKMNKDLDERLVPNGEYRDALNIEISTSEGSEVGSAQNLKGNEQVGTKSYTLSSSAISVGSYIDETNSHIYNFVKLASDLEANGTYSGKTRYTGFKSDAITRLTANDLTEEYKEEVVFCDVYEVRLEANAFSGTTVTGLPLDMPLYLRKGMRVQAIDIDGNDLWGQSNDVRIVQASWPNLIGASTGTIKITPVLNVNNIYTSTMISEGVVLRFTDEKILNFRDGTLELEQNNKNVNGDNVNSSAQYTPAKNIITGINIIDDLLYFTDGYDEPKKINISNSITGSGHDSSVATKHHTRLIIQKDGVNVNMSHAKKSHITLIKPAPTKAPTVQGFNSARDGITTSYLYDQSGTVFDLSPNGVLYNILDTLTLTTSIGNLNWKVGDVIRMTGVTSSIEVDLQLLEIINSTTYLFEIRNIPSSYTTSTPAEIWIARLFINQNIYEDKFVSFAYRYKYNDNEYSVISPYSKPLFIPGKYGYDPISGFNTGMVNDLKRIEVSDYIPYNKPRDIVGVELLYRETNSSNVYVIKRLKISDDEWTDTQSLSFHKGKTVINSQVFGSTIPSDQLLRLQDNVPLKAVAQEITGSRLMLGNYTENYDLVDGSKLPVKARILTDAVTTNINSELLVNSENTFEASQLEPIQTYDTVLPCGVEAIDGDIGDNYNTTTYKYTAPITGNYTFEASCKWSALNHIVAQNVNNIDYYMWIFPWARLDLINDGTGDTIAYGQIGGLDEDASIAFQESYFEQFTNQPFNGLAGNPLPTGNENDGFFINNFDISIPSYSPQLLTFNKTVYLTAGTVVYMKIVAQDATDNTTLPQGNISNGTNEYTYTLSNSNLPLDTFSWLNSTHDVQVTEGSFKCTAAPEYNGTFNITNGSQSVKTERKYQLGIVYRDRYNRQSTVLIDDDSALSISKQYSENSNKIQVKVLNKAPWWATHYKFFIKENAGIYHNLTLSAAYLNNDASALAQHLWLSFNSDDIDKVKKGDFIAAKKVHGTNLASNTPAQRWKVLDISNSNPISSDGVTPLIENVSEVVGKFFVKIAKDIYTNAFLGTSFPIAPSPNAAVFEVQPKETIDLDIYYELGNAYPVKLDANTLFEYIDKGAKLKLISVWDPAWVEEGAQAYRQDTIDSLKEIIDEQNLFVTGLTGAKSFSFNGIDNADYYSSAHVTVDQNVSLNLPVNGTIIIGFENKDGSIVSLSLAKSCTDSNILSFKPITHSYDNFNISIPIILPWYNCISFGNGVESDCINDDFNANRIFPYTSTGKQSGFNVNVVFNDYKQEHKKNDIIFSQIYNEKSNVNRFNEFLIDDDIVKQLTPEHGSIQKLYTRNTDLLAFCERKVLKIYANKDILYNADGNSQLTTSDKVLGAFSSFAGDYGISTNPESFAVDQYRIYFVDKAKGAVLRLSGDGITVISDYGMADWFNDTFKKSKSLIGSFDQDKGEYNITAHKITYPSYKKDVYTVSFTETTNGWSSFKSFILEQGASLNNQYYTLKNGNFWLHNSDNVSRNNFYGNQYYSSITPIVNDYPSSVKSFATINYEGTQSKVNQNTSDSNYYNLSSQNGWYVDYIQTDLQSGIVAEFLNKEGKWFNNILGNATSYTNPQEGVTTSNNLDTHNISVQGIGTPTNVDGTTTGFGYKISVNMTAVSSGWESSGFIEYNVTSKSNGEEDTFIISPKPGYSISATNFTAIGADTYVNSITYADNGTAGAANNTVTATINWKAITLVSDLIYNISDTGGYSENTFYYNTLLTIYRDTAKEDVTITSLVPSIDDSQGNVQSGATITDVSTAGSTIETYSVTGVTPKNIPINLYKVKLQAKPGLYYFNSGPTVNFSDNAQNQNAFEILSETVERNSLDLIISKTIIIKYNPTQDVDFSDEINVGYGGGTVISSYAVFNSNNIVVAYDASEIILPFSTNVSYLGFTATSTDDTNAAITAVTASYVKVNLTTNAESTRTFTISLFAANNASVTPNDTIVITQTQSGVNYVELTTLDGSSSITVSPDIELDPITLFSDGTTYGFVKSFYLYTNGAAPTLSTFYDGGETWLNPFVVYATSDPTVYIGRVSILQNTTGSSRMGTITLEHSADPGITDTLTITQEAYDSATDTVTFDDADNFISVDQYGISGTIDITAANITSTLPSVILQDPNNELSEYIILQNIVDNGGGSYSINYSVLANETTLTKTFVLKAYHPNNRFPNATANDTLYIDQLAIPYANFEPTEGVQSQIEMSSAGETDYQLNVNHNDYMVGAASVPNTQFLAYNSGTGLYDIDITTTPGITWIPYANVSWTNSANNVDGNGILEFDVSANPPPGSTRSIVLGVFHSNNSSTTPNDTITINQVSS